MVLLFAADQEDVFVTKSINLRVIFDALDMIVSIPDRLALRF